jgi:hypothetical protein
MRILVGGAEKRRETAVTSVKDSDVAVLSAVGLIGWHFFGGQGEVLKARGRVVT